LPRPKFPVWAHRPTSHHVLGVATGGKGSRIDLAALSSLREPVGNVPSPAIATLLHRLRDHESSALDAVRAEDCARVLDVDGICACRTELDEGLLVWKTIWCSDRTSQTLNDYRSRFVEGPGVHAVLANTAVLVPDLASSSVQARWPSYTKAALALGVHAVFAFPLRRLAVPFGAMVSYRRRPGHLQALDDATAFTEEASRVLSMSAPGASAWHVGTHARRTV